MKPEDVARQRELLTNIGLEDSSNDDVCDPSPNTAPVTDENTIYWENYKNNWITFNKNVLDQEYDTWVTTNVEYNISLNQSDLITDKDTFLQTYSKEYFYDQQYD